MRTDTGIAATNGTSGNAWWSISHRRNAVVHSAITTSLMVRPSAVLIALTSGSDTEVNA